MGVVTTGSCGFVPSRAGGAAGPFLPDPAAVPYPEPEPRSRDAIRWLMSRSTRGTGRIHRAHAPRPSGSGRRAHPTTCEDLPECGTSSNVRANSDPATMTIAATR